MTCRRWAFLLGAALLGSLAGCAPEPPAPTALPELPATATTGLVLEDVAPGRALDRAGLAAGDELLTWRSVRGTAGTFTDPWTLRRVELEETLFADAAVEITFRREIREERRRLPPGIWGGRVRAALPPELLRLYLQGQERIDSDLVGDLDLWRQAAEQAGAGPLASWLWLRIAQEGSEPAAFEKAAQAAKSPEILAAVLEDHCRFASRSSDASVREQGVPLCRQSLERYRNVAPGTALEAHAWQMLGEALLEVRNVPLAQEPLDEALRLFEELAPGSWRAAIVLERLATLESLRGTPGAAQEQLERARETIAKAAPGTLEQARVLSGLGMIRLQLSQLDAAQSLLQEAEALYARLSPRNVERAWALQRLGTLELRRGRLDRAETPIRQALDILEEQAPDSVILGNSLQALGVVRAERGDYEAARTLFERRLAIVEKQLPGSLEVARSTSNLGALLARQGDLAAARKYFERALEHQERLSPGSLQLSLTLANLGRLALDLGELDEAQIRLRQALELRRRLAPAGTEVADSCGTLGEVLQAAGRLEEADTWYREALALVSRLMPDSKEEARVLHARGGLLRQLGRTDEALEHFRRAVDALEAQRQHLGGTQKDREAFGAAFADFYQDYLDLLVATGRQDQAFGVLERSRAQELLRLLAERDVLSTGDLPAPLEERRRQTAEAYGATRARLAGLSAERDAAQAAELLERLGQLRREQLEIQEEVRRQAPALAAVRYPRPLSLGQAREALEEGTVVLAYSLGEEASHLFILPARGPLRVVNLTTTRDDLREAVERFRFLIDRGRSDAGDLAGLSERGRQLYDLLVAPAEPEIAAAHRVLIVPDGALHTLPFAALRRGEEYLVEWRPLSTVLSMTLYRQLGGEPGAASPAPEPATQLPTQPPTELPTELIAFGDPRPERPERPALGETAAEPASLRSRSLGPLPGSRQEVAAIADLFGPRARTFLSGDATEARVRAVAPPPASPRYLHFATHGFLDERFPLDSGLVLTAPEEATDPSDDGLLQAWEIFEGLRIDADLVTLSACETGLGRELAGEGLIGLTRAFQYAGARSVLASLWQVSDPSTAALMSRFYRHLQAGHPRDEALRQAQLDLLRAPRDSAAPGWLGRLRSWWNAETAPTPGPMAHHPFYWAAFQLSGARE